MADPNIVSDFVGPSIAAGLLAAIAGAAGGVVGDLLLPYQGKMGRLRRWGWYPSDRVTKDGKVTVVPKTHFDLGWVSSAFVGLVAALIALPLYPTEAGVLQASSSGVTFFGLKAIAFSALVGTSGGAVITGLRERALKLLEIKAEAVHSVNKMAKTSKDGIAAIKESLDRNSGSSSAETEQQIQRTLEKIEDQRNSSFNGNPSESDF